MENNRRVWSLIGSRPIWLYHPHAVMLGQVAHIITGGWPGCAAVSETWVASGVILHNTGKLIL